MIDLIAEFLGLVTDITGDWVKAYFRWVARFFIFSGIVLAAFGLSYAFEFVPGLKITSGIILVLLIVLQFIILPIKIIADLKNHGLNAINKALESTYGALYWILHLVLIFVILPLFKSPGAAPIIFLISLMLTLSYLHSGKKINPELARVKIFFVAIALVALLLVPGLKTLAESSLDAFSDKVEEKAIDWTKAPAKVDYDINNIDSVHFFNLATGEARIYYSIGKDGYYKLFRGLGYDPDTSQKLLKAEPNTKEKIKTYLIQKQKEELGHRVQIENQKHEEAEKQKAEDEKSKAQKADIDPKPLLIVENPTPPVIEPPVPIQVIAAENKEIENPKPAFKEIYTLPIQEPGKPSPIIDRDFIKATDRDAVLLYGRVELLVRPSIRFYGQQSRVGDIFEGTIINNVVSENHLVIPAGSKASGRVLEIVSPNRKHLSGFLKITLENIQIKNKRFKFYSNKILVNGDGSEDLILFLMVGTTYLQALD